MPDLPHGWRMRNKDGELRGPPPDEYGFFSGDEDDSDHDNRLDIRPDSEGWEDLEDDTEDVSIKCLLCVKTFPTANVMVDHCNAEHDFDFLQIQQQHKLDFYNTIKLVNYIRSQVSQGKTKPDVGDPSLWADDKYLQPALEEDGLLFSLDEIVDANTGGDDNNNNNDAEESG